ncbi:putative ABC transporter ATP-binding protein YheS [Aquicella siphonis]|uniref:Probable ATP-binding protein YheS n=1 Tax=Aquicella siphonis TaxID=254247 RepID=A0A5E4PJ39_9COXI|nr:ATP-binding cassette domain-containing protein [Aquicella siphonis]VVC77030.1 putative ABC transporter ATP-binding protein YheS [Aquicella siphonis]
MIRLRNITLRRGQHVLLQHLDWIIYHKQRIGIIGANGTGKSSLFSLLLKELQPEDGEIEIPKQVRLAHVAQETPAYAMPALEFVLDGDSELTSLQLALSHAEKEHDGERIAMLHEKLAVIDAYSAPARAAQLLDGLGFNPASQTKPVSAFSGGWRVRLNLAKALMSRSDVLLLDEPTNHLDLDAVLWLEQWLEQYHGTLLLISHDRDFLDHIVDHIAYVSHQSLTLYTGNYSSFEKQRAAELQVQQATYEKQQKQLAHLQSFVDRFRAKATKAKQAQSRLKAIERMDLVCAVQTESPFHFQFRNAEQYPNPLLTLEKASIGYDDKIVLGNINLSITPKDRIAILGPNGAGKSTLIKLLSGELTPAKGRCEKSAGLKIGYFAQHQVDELELGDNALLHLRRLAGKATDLELRAFLGGFGFSGDKVLEPVRNFSGGEKSRLALALLVWQKPNLLLLDEPTNHLDLEMRNALSLALQEYEGAMLLVSHDRFLVRTATDKLVLVADGKLEDFDGDLNDYQKWLIEYRKQAVEAAAPEKIKTEVSKREQRQLDARQRDMRRPLLQKIKQLECDLEKLQKEILDNEAALTDLTLYEPKNKERLQAYLIKQAALKKDMQTLEETWLQACEERDNTV